MNLLALALAATIAVGYTLASPALAAEPDGTAHGEDYWTTCEEAYRFCESRGYHRDCVIWRTYGAPLRRRTTEVCPIPERFHPRPEDGRMPWAELPEGTLLEDGTPVRPSGQKQVEDIDGPIRSRHAHTRRRLVGTVAMAQGPQL